MKKLVKKTVVALFFVFINCVVLAGMPQADNSDHDEVDDTTIMYGTHRSTDVVTMDDLPTEEMVEAGSDETYTEWYYLAIEWFKEVLGI